MKMIRLNNLYILGIKRYIYISRSLILSKREDQVKIQVYPKKKIQKMEMNKVKNKFSAVVQNLLILIMRINKIKKKNKLLKDN
jgi:fucose permease